MHRSHIREVRQRGSSAEISPRRGQRRPGANAYPRKFPRRKLRIEAFFAFVFILVILYIIGYLYTNALRPEISQMRVEMGVITQPVTFNGIIIREEAVYYAPDAGSLLFHVENHERVRAGRVVASIQDAGLVASYRNYLADIDQDAVNTQRQRTGVAINEDEIRRRNHAIIQYIDNAAFGLAAGDVGRIFALGDTARHGLESRNMLYFTDEIAMQDHATARERALAGMSQAISEVSATSSGIFSNIVDGLEGQLTVANLTNIPRELMVDGAVQMPLFHSHEVAPGDALFRVVRSSDWFIAAHICHEYAANWTTNTTVTLFIEDGITVIPLVTQVHSLRDAGQGEIYAVFRTNNDLMRFIDRRNITFRLSRDAQEGFKIPHAAIVERSRFPVPSEYVFIENNVWAVNLLVGDRIVTESVTGNFSNDGTQFFIMADSGRLRVGDTLVIQEEQFHLQGNFDAVPSQFVFNEGDAWTVRVKIGDSVVTELVSGNFSADGSMFQIAEGRSNLRAGDTLVRQKERFQLEIIDITTGVFVTNIGATQFREVTTEGSFAENADYIILDPARNPNLRLFDRIVADARAVSDRLLLH